MKMNRIFLAAAALALAATVARGQDLNPTVEVTNTYQSKFSDVRKPQIGMNIPDSLLRFDLDFDYEVFDKPYQGAYSFKPYMLAMKPEKDAWRGKSLYLEAGAGYSLHPVLEFVYSPEMTGRFQWSVYASHGSYVGRYHRIAPEPAGAGRFDLNKTGTHRDGHDLSTAAGFDGRVRWDRATLTFGAGYSGLATRDTLTRRSWNAADFRMRVKSEGGGGNYFLYDAGLRGRFATDNLDTSIPVHGGTDPYGRKKLTESWFVLEGEAGPVLDDAHSILVGFEGTTCTYGNLFEGSVGRLALSPRYRLRKGRWNLSLGLRFETIARGDQKDSPDFLAISRHKGRTFYPDVRVGFEAIEKHLSLYAGLTGSSHLNPYSSLIAGNHHVVPFYTLGIHPLIDNGVEKVNVSVGARGSVTSRLQFDVKAGGAVHENGLLDALSYDSGGNLRPSLTYTDHDVIFADLLLGWKSRDVSVEGAFHYRNTGIEEKTPEEELRNRTARAALELPAFSGTVRATWSINPRVYLGLAAEGASCRDAVTVDGTSEIRRRIPGWVDTGIFGGYRATRKTEVWARTGNLLGMNIQRNPFYAERGPWFTAGITLNL